MGPTERSTAQHYTWGEGCDGWHLLKDARLSVIEERMPPGTAERPHHHQRAQQFFYVLSGTATFELEGESVTVGARQGLHIKAGAHHRVFNRGAEDLYFLVVSEPPSHGDRVDSAT